MAIGFEFTRVADFERVEALSSLLHVCEQVVEDDQNCNHRTLHLIIHGP